MILSNKYKYVFIETPQTASTAISRELCTHYGGESVLRKHSSFQDLRRAVGCAIDDYYVFASVRNPLDIVVSKYFKAKNDHNGVFGLSFNEAKEQGKLLSWLLRKEYREYRFIHDGDTSFAEYLDKFYKTIYNSRLCMLPKRCNRLIRYENLNNDFSKVLEDLNIEQVQDIPLSNKTVGKEKDYLDFYTENSRKKVVKIFGPFMEKWGYDFPEHWNVEHIPTSSRLIFEVESCLRFFYYDKLHYLFFAPFKSKPVHLD